MLALARIVRLIASIVALVIIAAIVLRIAGANGANGVVHDIHSAGATLVGPFKNIFSLKSAKWTMAVNWGIAAVVYLLIGHLIAGLLARVGTGGYRRRRTAVV